MDDRDDDRNRNLDDERPRKKKSALPMILIILGVIGVVCLGVCGGVGYWFYSIGVGGQKAADAVLAKVGSGDLTGAYGSMSSTYKATHTQEQFDKAMKDAKLTDFASATWTNVQSNNQTMTMSGSATLKSGGTTPVAHRGRRPGRRALWIVDRHSCSRGEKLLNVRKDFDESIDFLWCVIDVEACSRCRGHA